MTKPSSVEGSVGWAGAPQAVRPRTRIRAMRRERIFQAIDLVLNIMALCLSSFVVAPMGFASSECDVAARKEYLERRKDDITMLVVNGLRKI